MVPVVEVSRAESADGVGVGRVPDEVDDEVCVRQRTFGAGDSVAIGFWLGSLLGLVGCWVGGGAAYLIALLPRE